jgi:uncharacterized protein
MELTCPKCQGTMRNYERSGITVDQCAECRGIFLDRGELEKLVDAESSFHASAQPAYGSPAGRQDRYRSDARGHEAAPRDDRYRDDRYREEPSRDYRYGDDKNRYRDGRDRDDDYYKKRKKRSFLEELFD